MLTSSCLFNHYDPTKPLILACDGLIYGLGAVLSHQAGQDEHPIAFASCSLAPAEKNYSQIDKEALAIVFGVKHFHQYLFGRSFNPFHGFSKSTALGTTLSAYNYKVQYVPGRDHANADVLS